MMPHFIRQGKRLPASDWSICPSKSPFANYTASYMWSVGEQRGIRWLPEWHKEQAGDSPHLPQVTASTVNQPDRGYHLLHNADGMTSHAALTYRNADRYRYDFRTKPR